jgi:lysophospholipid acyltransferase
MSVRSASSPSRPLSLPTVAVYSSANANLVKLITSFLLSYPLAGLLKRVPDEKPALKNLFIIG